MALVHESAPAPTPILRPGGVSPSWRSRGRYHGRAEVEPSPPQVQDQVQDSELARVRACPPAPLTSYKSLNYRYLCEDNVVRYYYNYHLKIW